MLCLTLLAPRTSLAEGGQSGAEGASQMANGIGSSLSNMLGMSSVALGTTNTQTGQQTQNMGQMALGAMQILMGLLGMLAAAGMGQNGDKAGNNQSGLSGLGGDSAAYPYSGTSPTGSNPNGGVGGSGTGASTKQGTTVSISPSDLRTGTVGAAMDALEKNYGLPRDKVLDALKAGVDPKSLLANAPKNAPSMDMLNKIADGIAANNNGGADGARKIASLAEGLGSAGAGGASASGTPTGDKSTETAAGAKAPAASAATDELDENGAKVSPEVKAALAAKAAELKAAQESKDQATWNLFQLVHNRYKKLETMLYGRVERTNPNPTAAVKSF